MGSVILLGLIIIVGLFISPIINNNRFYMIEGFKKYTDVPALYPVSVDRVLLNDYPQIEKNSVSRDNYSDIWWHYPIFTLGSYEQITNNLRYRYNPDDGECMRAEMCGAAYHSTKNKSNIINPLPPAEESDGARVGYFRTEPNNLFFSIPDNENILY
jgi:hypothetical protein